MGTIIYFLIMLVVFYLHCKRISDSDTGFEHLEIEEWAGLVVSVILWPIIGPFQLVYYFATKNKK